MKIVCLSFDDGTIYDLKFIELLNKYNLKASLNLNSELNDFVWYYEDKPIKRLDLSTNVNTGASAGTNNSFTDDS